MMQRILQELQARVSELERAKSQSFVRGVIAEIDHDKAKARVRYGEHLVSGWLSFQPLRCGKASLWWPLEVGEAVLVLSDGELANGLILPGFYSAENPAKSANPDLFLLDFGNGDKIEHNRASGVLNVAVSGDVNLNAGGNCTSKIAGNCSSTVSGDLKAEVSGSARVNAAKIHLNGDDPVVTKSVACSATGNWHCAGSPSVFAAFK